MSRVFPLEEWAMNISPIAPQHQPQSIPSTRPRLLSDISLDTYPGNSSSASRNTMAENRYRNRQISAPQPFDSCDLSEGIQNMRLSSHIQPSEVVEEEGKRKGGLRGLIRRASVSIRTNRVRRHSHTVEPTRPSTSLTPWMHRLKGAASFSRHSRFLHSSSDSEGMSSSPGLEDLLDDHPMSRPGVAGFPPVIPRGSGGAARATAAAQNERFGRYRANRFSENYFEDQESGIGIALTTSETDQYADLSIIRVDFIAKLPVELAIQILAYLDAHDLAHTSRVSKGWEKICVDKVIWRDAFLREKSKAYAMSQLVQPGTGLGIPPPSPENPWKDLYRVKQNLEHNWKTGSAEPVYLNGHLDSIYCIQFDEFKMITGSRDKTIRVWNMKTFQCVLVIGPPDVVNDKLTMYGNDGRPIHYAIFNSSAERKFECKPAAVSFDLYHKQSILCLQYDDNILVTGSSDSTCIVYDIKQGYKPIRRLEHHTAAVLDLAFDEKYIVTCSKDISICVWDRETGVILKELRGHTGPVNAVQMRGNTIVSCSGDFRVKLWNIETGNCIREFTGHTKGLACSQFSDDARFIASAGNDQIIRIWDANTGECLHQIKAHTNLVRSLHIDSVSGRLISGSYDQDIKVFDMKSGRLQIDFPKWHSSWVLGAKSDYRRIISTGQDPKILIMDFGMNIEGIDLLEGKPKEIEGLSLAQGKAQTTVPV